MTGGGPAGGGAPGDGGTMIRVLLVDDQELVRMGLRGILREPFGFTAARVTAQPAANALPFSSPRM